MEKLNEKEKILIVVDMINGFIKEGNMKDENIANIIPNIVDIAQKFQKENNPIIFIKDAHTLESIEFKKFPVHCLKGTSESQIVDELEEYVVPELTYEKNSTSARENKKLMKDIERMKALKEIVITGCCTDICILNLAIGLINYFDEKNINIQITVPRNAVDTFNSDSHNKDEYNDISLKLMKQAGINITEVY